MVSENINFSMKILYFNRGNHVNFFRFFPCTDRYKCTKKYSIHFSACKMDALESAKENFFENDLNPKLFEPFERADHGD